MVLAVAAQSASIRKDRVALSEGKTGIVVSAKLNSDLSSEYFGYFDFTLENKSDKWITLSRVEVAFPDSSQAQRIQFVSGQEFLQWHQAMVKIVAIDAANKKTAMAALGAIGYGLASFSGNRGVQAVGLAAATGAVGAYGVQQFSNWQDSLERAKMHLENHLLADTIRILPGLYVDRWLLVNSRGHDNIAYTTQILLKIETTEGMMETFKLDFRTRSERGAAGWQRSVFDRLNPKAVCTQYGGYSTCP